MGSFTVHQGPAHPVQPLPSGHDASGTGSRQRGGAIAEPAATPGAERGKRVSAEGGTEEMG